MNVVHEQPKDAEDIVRAGAGIVVAQLQAAGEANVGDEYKTACRAADCMGLLSPNPALYGSVHDHLSQWC